MNKNDIIKVASVLLLDEALDDDGDVKETNRGKRREWIKRRHQQGYQNNLIKELLAEDTKTYKEMMWMPCETFLRILRAIEEDITPKNNIGGTETYGLR